MLWIGYCAFHMGDYQRAQQAYTDILKVSPRLISGRFLCARVVGAG
jgi:hypothetical protein